MDLHMYPVLEVSGLSSMAKKRLRKYNSFFLPLTHIIQEGEIRSSKV